MTKVNSDVVENQLSELDQQIVHVLQASNEGNEVLEQEFDLLENVIVSMESRLQREKVQINSEGFGVGSMTECQGAVLEELRCGIHVLQEQNNQIVGEGTDLFAGIRSELDAQSKKITDNGLQVFAQKVSIQDVQNSVGVLSKRIDEANKFLATITESMKSIPSKIELHQHHATMDRKSAQVEEINTRLTTAIGQYIFSESTPFEF
jgi:hypothetical protein